MGKVHENTSTVWKGSRARKKAIFKAKGRPASDEKHAPCELNLLFGLSVTRF